MRFAPLQERRAQATVIDRLLDLLQHRIAIGLDFRPLGVDRAPVSSDVPLKQARLGRVCARIRRRLISASTIDPGALTHPQPREEHEEIAKYRPRRRCYPFPRR